MPTDKISSADNSFQIDIAKKYAAASDKTGALRYNAGKFRPSLVPPALIEGCARGMTYGAQKYSDNNWRKGFNWTDVLDSLERHLLAFKQSEDLDEESGLHQLDLMACNLGMLMEFVKTGNGVDNRFVFKKDVH